MKSHRRRLLKALTLGGGAVTVSKLPASWSKPVTESVMLPVHAQTSPGSSPCVIRVSIFMELTGEVSADVGFDLFDADQCYGSELYHTSTEQMFSFPELGPGAYFLQASGNLDLAAGSGEFNIEVSCCDESATAMASVGNGTVVDSDSLILRITIGDDGTCSFAEVATPPSPC
ncbi:MAG: hypothetical protein WB783_01030 [Arenicellales bacterium]